MWNNEKVVIFLSGNSESNFFFTHWHTGSSFEVAIMPTPGSNGTMPEHIGLGLYSSTSGWVRRLLLTSGFGSRTGSRSLVVTNVNFTDEPLKWVSFNHRWRWSRLNGGKSIDSTAESVTRIRSRTRDRTRTRSRTPWRSDDSRATSKGRLSSPNFVTFLCGILNNFTFFYFICSNFRARFGSYFFFLILDWLNLHDIWYIFS